jgi:hypothetical protein
MQKVQSKQGVKRRNKLGWIMQLPRRQEGGMTQPWLRSVRPVLIRIRIHLK